MKWKKFVNAKWKLIIVLLLICLLIYFIIIPTFLITVPTPSAGCSQYGYFCIGWSYGPLCIGRVKVWSSDCIFEPVKLTNSWHDDYLVEEKLNTFELPYSNATFCKTDIIISISGFSKAFKEEDKITVSIHSINLDGSELLSESTILSYQYLSGLDSWFSEPLLLDYELKKNEGVLKVTMSATESINVTIEMAQYEEFCRI